MNQRNDRSLLAGLLILFAMATRVAFNDLHFYNFNAVMASGIFAGAYLGRNKEGKSSWIGILVPLVAMLATDLVIGLYDWKLMAAIYASLLASVFIGKYYAKHATLLQYTGSVLGGSLLFFIVTNGAVWLLAEGSIYPKTIAGLLQCYTEGLPFYRNTLLGDITWSTVLFGTYELFRLRTPKTQLAS
ncbi:MAG TPA: DUF6580 family putative transport protein [Candidatus Kapabacteria bacterium]|jgi:hypothetical protein|nr:DUF6580 family putative transport protein [Candidatus Kapabacteria bacterium]